MAKNQKGTDALIDRRIRELCETAGLVTPYNKNCVQPCSYDVHLGYRAHIDTPSGLREFDLGKYSVVNPFYMEAGDFLLGETIENIRLPFNVEAHLHLVSSRAREGLQHAVSGLVDCGWDGVLTLELKNNLRYGEIGIYPGLRIAQLTFFEYDECAENPYFGRYFGDTAVSKAKDGQDFLHF